MTRAPGPMTRSAQGRLLAGRWFGQVRATVSARPVRLGSGPSMLVTVGVGGCGGTVFPWVGVLEPGGPGRRRSERDVGTERRRGGRRSIGGHGDRVRVRGGAPASIRALRSDDAPIRIAKRQLITAAARSRRAQRRPGTLLIVCSECLADLDGDRCSRTIGGASRTRRSARERRQKLAIARPIHDSGLLAGAACNRFQLAAIRSRVRLF